MITSMRRCVACDDLWPWPISSRSFDLDFENRVRSVMFSVLDRLFFWLGIQYDPIVWVIMRRRGVSSERRRSSCSSLTTLKHEFAVQYIMYSTSNKHLNFELDAWLMGSYWQIQKMGLIHMFSKKNCNIELSISSASWQQKLRHSRFSL